MVLLLLLHGIFRSVALKKYESGPGQEAVREDIILHLTFSSQDKVEVRGNVYVKVTYSGTFLKSSAYISQKPLRLSLEKQKQSHRNHRLVRDEESLDGFRRRASEIKDHRASFVCATSV